ncbi:MAG: integrase [Dyella sp.]
MVRGRKRKHDPSIPAHIDQHKLPAGVYWDRRWSVWYTIHAAAQDQRARRQNIAGKDVLLSDLHKAIEDLRGVNRRALAWLLSGYHDSHFFKALAESTRSAYETQRQVALAQRTKLGVPFGDIDFAPLQTHHFQALVDRIADEGTPSKANSLMRYLKLVFSWAKRRGYVQTNPVKGVKQAKARNRRRLPSPVAMTKLIQLAAHGATVRAHATGSCPPYLWAVADIAYLCRLRGIEVVTMHEDQELPEGLLTNRRKGSRDNIVSWTPRLRAAWDHLITHRDDVWRRKSAAIPLHAKDRVLVVAETGGPLVKSSLDTAWQRLIQRAIKNGVIAEDERFGLHDLKRRGVTDTAGTRADKQHASGHKSESMMDIYDLSVPIVNPSNLL